MHDLGICVIPAKAGSSRLPYKNFRQFYGEYNLTELAILFAVKVGFDEIYVSSEDEGKILSIDQFLKSKGLKNVVADLRPSELAHDPATVKDVVIDILEKYNPVNSITRADTVTVILPTSPLNDVDCVKRGLLLSRDNPKSRILSVSKNSKPPFNSWSFLANNSLIMENTFRDSHYAKTQSTRCPDTYMSNGCFSIWKIDDRNSLIEETTVGIAMPALAAVDIDTELEFLVAQFLYKKFAASNS